MIQYNAQIFLLKVGLHALARGNGRTLHNYKY